MFQNTLALSRFSPGDIPWCYDNKLFDSVNLDNNVRLVSVGHNGNKSTAMESDRGRHRDTGIDLWISDPC